MTLLELYEKLCTGEIKLRSFRQTTKTGLCWAIATNMELMYCFEFGELFMFDGNYLRRRGVMTPERETFLLLFAAYKGEL